MNIEERKKKLEELRAKIGKDMGKGAVMNLAEKPDMAIEAISTGSLGLDLALGIGGLPKGRIVEIYGPESSGKTTLAIHTIAESQKKGGYCAIIDAEHAFDTKYAEALGVDMGRLDINQPDWGEQGLEIADRLISSGLYDVVVIDSVAALVPKAEIEGEMGENKLGLHARLMSQALRKLTPAIDKTNTLVIFINQLREKIGVMFGSPEVTTGGNSLKFYASVRLDVRRSTTAANSVIKDDIVEGNLTKVKVIKSKVSPPFRTCEFNILYGQGIDKLSEIIDIASQLDIINKGGAWFTYKDYKVQGVDNLKQLLVDNEELRLEIEELVKAKING